MKKIYQEATTGQEYGGAPLLGVGGYCLICTASDAAHQERHPRRQAVVVSRVNDKIVEKIAGSSDGEKASRNREVCAVARSVRRRSPTRFCSDR
jgi:hypothetical protein